MLAQTICIEYLLSTPTNYTCTHWAAHLPDVSQDQVNRFLRTRTRPINQLRKLVLPLLRDSPEAFLLVADSVSDKRYSRFIDVAKRPHSGNAHGMVTGIGLVNLVHSSGEAGDFLPLDYRVYASDHDGQPKNDHFPAMFDQLVTEGNLLDCTIVRGQHQFEAHSPRGVALFHDPEKQPVGAPGQRKRLPGAGCA